MVKLSRRRRVVIAASTLVSSAVTVVVATTSHNNNIALQNNDPAAAPTLHITHSSSNNNNDGEHHHQDNNKEDAIMVPPPSSSQTLTTVFSCGTHWRSAQTCDTLCPSGRDTDCPDGQYCYGGIPSCSTNDDDDNNGGDEKSMDEMLKEQSRLEQQLLNNIQGQNDQQYTNKFVCGTSYNHASSTCNTRSSTILPSRTNNGLHPFASQAIYCSNGSSESCPSNMECYIAQCATELHSKERSGILSLVDEIGSWLVQLFDKQSLLFSTSQNDEEKEEEIDYNSTSSSRDDSVVGVEEDEDDDRVVLNEWKAYFRREGGVGTLFASSSSERYALN